MTWIIIGLISFTIQMYILKHTWVDSDEGLDKFRWEHAQKLGIPLWAALLMLLSCLLPILNIIEFILFWVVWFSKYKQAEDYNSYSHYTYWRFKDKFLSRKI